MDEELTVTVTSLGNRVGGISTAGDRKTVFVRGALPGEKVKCRILKTRKKLIEADLVEILEESPHRTAPFCRYFGECGGCSLQNLDYPRQLFWKRNWIEKALSRAGIDFPGEALKDVVPSPRTRRYRNRVSFDIVSGRPGLHRFRGDTMEVDECPLLCPGGKKVFGRLLGQELDGCRRVSVRASERTGETMVEYSNIPASGIMPGKDCGILSWNENGTWKTDPPGAVLHETAGGFTYPVRPGTFFQVNNGCADIIISMVRDICCNSKTVLDLYGGCGTFALPLASAGAEVTSVELNRDSSVSGEEAALESGTTGVTFLTGRVRHCLLDAVRTGQKWDAVIVDPPRAGMGIRIARILRRLTTEKIVYVSCNPFSLARDLRIICEGGWAVADVLPVDMFPHTDHVETVVELRKKEDI